MHPGGDTEPWHFFTSDTGFGQNSHQMPGRALHAKPHSLGVPPRSWAPWSYSGGGVGGGKGRVRAPAAENPTPDLTPSDSPKIGPHT